MCIVVRPILLLRQKGSQFQVGLFFMSTTVRACVCRSIDVYRTLTSPVCCKLVFYVTYIGLYTYMCTKPVSSGLKKYSSLHCPWQTLLEKREKMEGTFCASSFIMMDTYDG